MKCDGISLVMSDVEGDDLSSIASGTTYMDDTTYANALEILKKYKLRWRMPSEVLQVLENGLENEKPLKKSNINVDIYTKKYLDQHPYSKSAGDLS